MAGDADLDIGTKLGTRIARIAIILPEMNAIGAKPLGKPDAVIDDERNIMFGADRLQRCREPRSLMLVNAFDAELECRHRPRAQRRAQLFGKITVNVERRNQIKLAFGAPDVADELDSKIGRKFVFNIDHAALPSRAGQFGKARAR